MDYRHAFETLLAARANPQAGLNPPYFMRAFACPHRPSEILLKPGQKATSQWDFLAPLVIADESLEISHVAIMVDLYSKVVYNGVDGVSLRGMLRGLSALASPFSFSNLAPALQEYRPGAPPPKEVLAAAEAGVEGTRQRYNRAHNRIDLCMDELFNLAFWIILQEEVNYGAFNDAGYGTGWGRRLPLSRYMEAVEAGAKRDLQRFEEYVRWACNKGRPVAGRDPSIDYGF